MSFKNFRGYNSIGDYDSPTTLKTSIIAFLNWSFLELGAFANITIPLSGAYGGREDILRPVRDDNYTDGRVWQSVHDNWVWESGLTSSYSPINISGIFIDDVFKPTSGGDFFIDYPNGRIIFDIAQTLTSEVKLEYSFKWVNIYDSDSVDFLDEINNQYRVDSAGFQLLGSGDYARLGDIKLPAIVVEYAHNTNYEAYAYGMGTREIADVICNVLGSPRDVNRISNIISRQDHKTIFALDLAAMRSSGQFPLNYNGSIASGAMSYPDLVKPQEDGGYRLRKIYFKKIISEGESRLNRFLSQVPVNIETDFYVPNI